MHRALLVLLLVAAMISCSKTNEQTSTRGCPIRQYDNTKLPSGNLSYDTPASWKEVEPSSDMRLYEYLMDKDTDTRLGVFFFPRMRDAVEANLRRWKAQFKEDSARQLLEKKQFNRRELPITVYHITGNFLESTDANNPQSRKNLLNNQSLLAAIVEMKAGTWFFHTRGPRSVIEGQRAIFNDLVYSFERQKS